MTVYRETSPTTDFSRRVDAQMLVAYGLDKLTQAHAADRRAMRNEGGLILHHLADATRLRIESRDLCTRGHALLRQLEQQESA